LVLKPEGKTQLRRHRCRGEDNTGMNFREIEWEVVDWIHLAQEEGNWQTLVNAVMDLRVP
jgi:hypothetical protein